MVEGEAQPLEEGFLTNDEIVARGRRKLSELKERRLEWKALADKAKAAKKLVTAGEAELEQIITGKRDPQLPIPTISGKKKKDGEIVRSAEEVVASMAPAST